MNGFSRVLPILYAYVGFSSNPARCLQSLLLALVAFSSVGHAAEALMCERGEAARRAYQEKP